MSNFRPCSSVLMILLFGCVHSAKNVDVSRIPSNTPGPISQAPLRVKCSAISIETGTMIGPVEILTDVVGDPLVSVTSRKIPNLNFKMGRRFAAGNDYSNSNSLNCRYKSDSHGALNSLDYFCDSADLPEDASTLNVKNFDRRSTFVYSVSESGSVPTRICRTSRSCVDIKNCSSF